MAGFQRLGGDARGSARGGVDKRTIRVEARGGDEVEHGSAEGFEVGDGVLAVFREERAEFGGLPVESRATARRDVVADDDAVPAALRDDGLGGVVRGVDVHVGGHGAEELIGPAQAVVTEGEPGSHSTVPCMPMCKTASAP